MSTTGGVHILDASVLPLSINGYLVRVPPVVRLGTTSGAKTYKTLSEALSWGGGIREGESREELNLTAQPIISTRLLIVLPNSISCRIRRYLQKDNTASVILRRRRVRI